MPAKMTVWSPTTSPPRRAMMPISRSRALADDALAAVDARRAAKSRPSASGDGARRGPARCRSGRRPSCGGASRRSPDRSRRRAPARRRATRSSSTLTPTLMLGAITRRGSAAPAGRARACCVGVEAGGADDDRGAAAHGGAQVLERRRRRGEVERDGVGARRRRRSRSVIVTPERRRRRRRSPASWPSAGCPGVSMAATQVGRRVLRRSARSASRPCARRRRRRSSSVDRRHWSASRPERRRRATPARSFARGASLIGSSGRRSSSPQIAHHRHRRLDRDRIGFEEQRAHQRQHVVVQPRARSASRRAQRRRPSPRHCCGHHVGDDRDDADAADRHDRQGQRVVAGVDLDGGRRRGGSLPAPRRANRWLP